MAKTAAIGVGSFFAAFLITEAIKTLPDDLRRIGDALTAIIAPLVAATVAWLAFHGTMTVGTAIPIILGAVGAGILAIKDLVEMAEGGIVTKPTIALVGEAGPEAVVPLDRGGFGETRQNIVIYPTINIESISRDFSLEDVHDVIVEGLGDGVNEYIAEKYRRRT